MDYPAVVNTKEPIMSRLLIMKLKFIILIFLILTLNSVYGQEARDFTITDTKGESWNLFDELAKGKTVVLDFFFADCTPCQRLTPALAKIYSSYDTDSLLVFGISDRDDNFKVDKFESEFGANYPSAGTEGGGDTVTNLYRSYFSFIGWPTYAVVCPNRQIRWDLERDTNFVELKEEIEGCIGTLSAQDFSKLQLNIFPNPTMSSSIIMVDYKNKGPNKVTLVSSSGQVILSQESIKNNTVKIPKCADGIYYIKVVNGNNVYQSKVLINNN